MTDDPTPMKREELEAKVTALLLGELTESEAALMRELIARDAGLARLQERLKMALHLLRETAATPEPIAREPMKLSPDKREKLLAHFKTVAPKEFAKAERKPIVRWQFAVAVLVAMMGLFELLTPPVAHSKKRARESFSAKSMSIEEVAGTASPEVVNHGAIGLQGGTAPTTSPLSAAAPVPGQIVLPASTPSPVDEQQLGGGRYAREGRGSRGYGGRANRAIGSANAPAGSASIDMSQKSAEGRSSFQQNLAQREPTEKAQSAANAPVVTDLPAFTAAPAVPVAAAAPALTFNYNSQNVIAFGGNGVAARDLAKAPTGRFPAKAVYLPQQSNADRQNTPILDLSQISTQSPNAYSLNAVGYINASNVSNIVEVPVIATSDNNIPVHGFYMQSNAQDADSLSEGKISGVARSGTAVSTTTHIPTTATGTAGPGNGQVGSANFYVDKDSGQVVALPPDAATDKVSALDAKKLINVDKFDAPLPQPALPAPIPPPEVLTSTNIFSTFSLNVSDAGFKLTQASLQNNVMPAAAGIRSEEFINAFDYRDAEPAPGAPIGFAWERAGDPFAHNRDFLRFSVKTAAQGRQGGRPLNLVLLLDKSGSMERADRVEIIHQALRVLATQLQAQDTLSVVVFARTPRLWVDGVPGNQAGDIANGLHSLTPEGGTNLEEAMKLAYATALRHYRANGENRVVLLTDGAANLGSVDPEALKRSVEANRKQGLTLDCFGVGFDGYNDNMMETLSRSGNGRYGFLNTPEEAATEFAGKLAGAFRVAASDVKVQVEFNPNRVTSYRQIGYAKHQLTKEQFRDNSVAAAQIGAAESGNALYTVAVNPTGDGPLCTVRVRFRVPGTTDYQEHAWDVPYTGTAVALDQASPAMRLAGTSAAFAEWLASSPYAGEVTPDRLLALMSGVPEVYGADTRPKQLEWMIRQAKSISGK